MLSYLFNHVTFFGTNCYKHAEYLFVLTVTHICAINHHERYSGEIWGDKQVHLFENLNAGVTNYVLSTATVTPSLS